MKLHDVDWRRLASRPSVVIASLAAGVCFGLWYPAEAQALGLLSEVYLGLLKMVVLPFMVSAIIFSLYRLFQDPQASHILASIVGYFCLAMVLAALLGLLVAALGGPGRDLAPETMLQLGRLVGAGNGGVSDEVALGGELVTPQTLGFADMLRQIIPGNIFAALAQGETLKAFIFALLFGCALSQVSREVADSLSSTLESVFHTCQTLTRWFNYFLPPVLFAMVSSQIARTGLEPLKAMLGFILAMSGSSLVLVLLSFWILVRVSGCGWREVLASQREPLTMAVATRSSHACMPAMMEALVERLGFPHYRIELLVPLGVSILRIGPALYYAVATLFIAQLYERDLSLTEYTIVFIGSILAGLASTGMSSLLVLSLIGLVCGFLALPFEAALVLFVAVEPVCDVLRTLVLVAGNSAVAALICGRPAAVAQPGLPEARPC